MLQRIKYVVTRSALEFLPLRIHDMAATLTFFTVLSFAPGLLAVYSLATILLLNQSDTVNEVITNLIVEYVPEEFHQDAFNIVGEVLGSQTGGIIGLTLGLLVVLWSAGGYVRAFSRCVNELWGYEEGRAAPKMLAMNFLTSTAVILGVALIVVILALQLPIILAVVVAGGLIAMLYRFAPTVQPRWRGWGAGFAIIGIGLVAGALYLYLTYFTALNSYGAIGTVVAVSFALWGMNIVLLLGVKIDVEVERFNHGEIDLPRRGTKRLEYLERIDSLFEKLRDV